MKAFIRSTRIITLTLFLILVLGTAGQAIKQSELAAEVVYKGGTKTIHLVPDFKKNNDSNRSILAYTYVFDDEHIKYTYKSSNPSVVTVFAEESCVSFYAKKTGTATLTFSYKLNGKTHSYKTKFIVKKWEYPLKSLKIGKKSYESKFKKNDIYWAGYIKGKINVVPAKNWKLVSIKKKVNDYKTVTYKNKSKIELDYNTSLIIKLKNTKTKHVEELILLYPPFG